MSRYVVQHAATRSAAVKFAVVFFFMAAHATSLTAQTTLSRSVTSNHATDALGSGLRLRGTIGQTIAGVADGSVHAGLGFWHKAFIGSAISPIVVLTVLDDTIDIGTSAAAQIRVDRADGIRTDTTFDLRCSLTVNANVISPYDAVTVREYANGELTVPFTSAVSGATTSIAGSTLLAKLGDAEFTTAVLANAIVVGVPNATVITRPGKITIGGICRDGDGPRLVREFGAAALSVIGMQPVRERLGVSVTQMERGIHELSLSNSIGQRVVVVSLHSEPGTLIVSIPVGDLSNGTYVLSLQTPSELLSQVIAIAK